MSLNIWTSAVMPEALGSALGKASEIGGFKNGLLEWWNAPAQFGEAAEIKIAIDKKAPDLISGSLFGPAAEVRFRKVENEFWLVLISDTDIVIGDETNDWKRVDPKTLDWDGFSPKEKWLNLWGSQYRSEYDDWVELRIPRPLKYPVEQKDQGSLDLVQLQVKEYHSARGAVVAAFRCGLRSFTAQY